MGSLFVMCFVCDTSGAIYSTFFRNRNIENHSSLSVSGARQEGRDGMRKEGGINLFYIIVTFMRFDISLNGISSIFFFSYFVCPTIVYSLRIKRCSNGWKCLRSKHRDANRLVQFNDFFFLPILYEKSNLLLFYQVIIISLDQREISVGPFNKNGTNIISMAAQLTNVAPIGQLVRKYNFEI